MTDEENTEAATTFVWSEPPAKAKRRGGGKTVDPVWLSVAQSLEENSGNWAQVATHEVREDEPDGRAQTRAQNMSFRIKHAKLKAFEPAGHYEATARPLDSENPDGDWGVWARHVGQKPEAEEGDTDTEAEATEEN